MAIEIVPEWMTNLEDEDVENLKKQSKTIDDEKSISQVASISAGDESVGELISKAMQKGPDTDMKKEEVGASGVS